MQKLCQHVLGGGQGGNEAEALAAVVPATPLRRRARPCACLPGLLPHQPVDAPQAPASSGLSLRAVL